MPALTTWRGARFSVDYPEGWVVQEKAPDLVVFDGRRESGPFAFGNMITIVVADSPVPSQNAVTDGGGSHVLDKTLTVTQGLFTVKLSHSYGTDGLESESDLEQELRAFARLILPTLRIRE